jgi:hypothetical protein
VETLTKVVANHRRCGIAETHLFFFPCGDFVLLFSQSFQRQLSYDFYDICLVYGSFFFVTENGPATP